VKFPNLRLDPHFLQLLKPIRLVHVPSELGSLDPAGEEELVCEVCTPFYEGGADTVALVRRGDEEDVEDCELILEMEGGLGLLNQARNTV